jgi:serine phosphatase RsbU (regulator of sigma subunit)
MGQLRGLLRGISYDSADSPAGVLTRLDRAMDGLQLRTLATVIVARLEQTPDEVADGVTRLRWSNAGHPPPVVLLPDGSTEVLTSAPAELLVGVHTAARRTDHVVTLPRGSTVLLYTDGLVERRDRDLDAGTAELIEVLRGCADLSLDDLCDEVLERLFLPDAQDDVAMLALRLYPQDEPRPVEAGPQVVPASIEPAPDVQPEAGAGD